VWEVILNAGIDSIEFRRKHIQYTKNSILLLTSTGAIFDYMLIMAFHGTDN
jgi:hypothetical protein